MSAFSDSLSRCRPDAETRGASLVPDPALAARLDTLHRDGLAAFGEQGLPTRRDERWKGTNTAAIEALSIERIGPDERDLRDVIEAPIVTGFDADLLVVDGRVVNASPRRADLPAGVRILSLAEAATEMPEVVAAHLGHLADPKQDAFAALNTALFEDLVVVELAASVRLERALRVLCVATAEGAGRASACFPRLLVVAGEASEGLLILESRSLGSAPGFTSLVSEIRLAAGARFGAIMLQQDSAERIHLAQTFAELDRDAHFDSHVLSLGEGFVRSELSVGLQAPGATTRMNGFFLGRKGAHHDHFTTVDHAAPHCSSDEEYRGVLADRSQGVFRGRVIVRPDAQKTDARQSNPNLLLSNSASIDTKPQLEIYADDVKASHGSTIGQLDADALFFLRARGIDEREARLLLTRGFARAIVDGIHDAGARAHVDARVETALASLDRDREEDDSA